MAEKPFRVFYAWQSDGDQKANRFFIRAALQGAITAIESGGSGPPGGVIFEEAARGEPGSPNIATTILQRIANADAFVCDVTTINPEAATGRRTPNPNVVFELGFAVAKLGWERVIYIFNDGIGQFPGDLPFDLKGHIATHYTLRTNQPKDERAVAQRKLQGECKSALETIVAANPRRPGKSTTKKEIKRQRDVATLLELLPAINFKALEIFATALPRQLKQIGLDFFKSFDVLWTQPANALYDRKVRNLIARMHGEWRDICEKETYYREQGRSYHFPPKEHRSMDDDLTYVAITLLAASLRRSYKALAEYLHSHYVEEINLREIEKKSWQDYVDPPTPPF